MSASWYLAPLELGAAACRSWSEPRRLAHLLRGLARERGGRVETHWFKPPCWALPIQDAEFRIGALLGKDRVSLIRADLELDAPALTLRRRFWATPASEAHDPGLFERFYLTRCPDPEFADALLDESLRASFLHRVAAPLSAMRLTPLPGGGTDLRIVLSGVSTSVEAYRWLVEVGTQVATRLRTLQNVPRRDFGPA